MIALRACSGLLLAGLLAGCVTQPVRDAPLGPAAQARAEAAQTLREQALLWQPDWGMHGRVAVSNGRDGGSGRIEWRQTGATYVIELSAPVTRQSWRLSGGAAGARLDGVAGGSRQGPDAAVLLREATGWEIPVQALAYWVRGARAPAGPAELAFGADGQLTTLQQDGWRIDYRDWRLASGMPALPRQIEARRGTARVRLLVDDWSADAGPET